MDKIKAFIVYATEMEQKIADAFQRSQSLYVFDSQPYYIRLQLEMTERAKEVGVLNIYKEKGYANLTVLLESGVFHAMDFKNVEKKQNTNEGDTWILLKAVESDVVYEACELVKETKNASA